MAALTTLVPLWRLPAERRESIVGALKAAGRTLSELVSWIPAFSVRRS